jgi:Flp pilus assembly protein TadG
MYAFRVKSENGATMLEYAIVMPLFLVMLLVFADFLRVCYYNLTLGYALTQATRVVVITPQGNAADVRTIINQKLVPLGIDLQTVDILTVCPLADLGNTTKCPAGTYNPGEKRDLVAYQVSKPVTVYTMTLVPMIGLRNLTLTATVVVRNEPV